CARSGAYYFDYW
nr:immunoglobulin heavy chain junction region [Mus musculus]